MKLGVVSTFSDKGYHEYGKHFVESCRRFLDPNITVYIYVDNIVIENQNLKNVMLIECRVNLSMTV
mgnify:CR=1 FL=1